MQCREIIKALDELAPRAYACDWDNPGFLAGRADKEVKTILVALDATDEVIDQAAWNETIRSFADGSVYALKQEGENYIFEIDAPDEEEYVLAVSGTHNTASWDRFLNK